jgi:hypothetical protein
LRRQQRNMPALPAIVISDDSDDDVEILNWRSWCLPSLSRCPFDSGFLLIFTHPFHQTSSVNYKELCAEVPLRARRAQDMKWNEMKWNEMKWFLRRPWADHQTNFENYHHFEACASIEDPNLHYQGERFSWELIGWEQHPAHQAACLYFGGGCGSENRPELPLWTPTMVLGW